MNRRNPSNNRYHFDPRSPGGAIKGVHVVLLLLTFLVVLNLAMLNAIFISPDSGIQGYRAQQEQERGMESKIARLKRDNQRLFRRIQNLKTDDVIQERLIRQQLGWVRGNEIIVEFPPKMP